MHGRSTLCWCHFSAGCKERQPQTLAPHRRGRRNSPGLWPLQANLVCSCLAGEAELKQQFIATRRTLERLEAERQLLQQLGSVQQSGCSLM